MSATLNLYSLTLAVGDPTQSNNPQLRYADWKRTIQGIAVDAPSTKAYVIAPGVEQLIFDGTTALTVDNTTVFNLTLSALDPSLYRLAWVSGTKPGFRTDRNLALSGVQLTLTVQANDTLTMVAGAGTPFSAVQATDQIFIPGAMTGDSPSPFNVLNQGWWNVLAVSGGGSGVTLVRPGGSFQGTTETITPSNNTSVLGFSAAGVQDGDGLQLLSGFQADALKSYVVVNVTALWVEVRSTAPVANETGVSPTAAGIASYSNAKRFLQIEADQDCVLRLNGDTSSILRLTPWLDGDPSQVAEFKKVGATWKLTITNKSALPLNATVISAE